MVKKNKFKINKKTAIVSYLILVLGYGLKNWFRGDYSSYNSHPINLIIVPLNVFLSPFEDAFLLLAFGGLIPFIFELSIVVTLFIIIYLISNYLFKRFNR